GLAFPNWRRLWRKWQDYEGKPMNPNCSVVTTYAPYPAPYRVPRAKAKVDLAGEWDSLSWAHVKPLKLISCMKRAGDKDVFLPDTQAKLQYDEQFLYVMFQVNDRYVLANAKNDQTDVCLDSCVEFFLRPPETAQYYNFEMSCNGKMLLCEIINLSEGKLNFATEEELKSIERFHTVRGLVRHEIQEPLT
ncbi:MAG: carbohydrate-binding family 9-like protein, partial [Victivallales bacterium]|nr:carbohydrate-binding family 9-like protein [Victivallales bacterium]